MKSENTSMSESRRGCFSLLFDLFGFGPANRPDLRPMWLCHCKVCGPSLTQPPHEMGVMCRPLVALSEKDAARRRFLHRHLRGTVKPRYLDTSSPPGFARAVDEALSVSLRDGFAAFLTMFGVVRCLRKYTFLPYPPWSATLPSSHRSAHLLGTKVSRSCGRGRTLAAGELAYPSSRPRPRPPSCASARTRASSRASSSSWS